jgi:hypothetical protein
MIAIALLVGLTIGIVFAAGAAWVLTDLRPVPDPSPWMAPPLSHLDEAEALLALSRSKALRHRPRTAAALAARAQAHAALAAAAAQVAAAGAHRDWPDFERAVMSR